MAASSKRGGRAAALMLVAVLLSGCATWRGARHYARGNAALDAGDPARAIVELEAAAALVPHASEVRNHLGLAYAASGRVAEARRAFRSALELDCGNEAARQNLVALDARERAPRRDESPGEPSCEP